MQNGKKILHNVFETPEIMSSGDADLLGLFDPHPSQAEDANEATEARPVESLEPITDQLSNAVDFVGVDNDFLCTEQTLLPFSSGDVNDTNYTERCDTISDVACDYDSIISTQLPHQTNILLPLTDSQITEVAGSATQANSQANTDIVSLFSNQSVLSPEVQRMTSPSQPISTGDQQLSATINEVIESPIGKTDADILNFFGAQDLLVQTPMAVPQTAESLSLVAQQPGAEYPIPSTQHPATISVEDEGTSNVDILSLFGNQGSLLPMLSSQPPSTETPEVNVSENHTEQSLTPKQDETLFSGDIFNSFSNQSSLGVPSKPIKSQDTLPEDHTTLFTEKESQSEADVLNLFSNQSSLEPEPLAVVLLQQPTDIVHLQGSVAMSHIESKATSDDATDASFDLQNSVLGCSVNGTGVNTDKGEYLERSDTITLGENLTEHSQFGTRPLTPTGEPSVNAAGSTEGNLQELPATDSNNLAEISFFDSSSSPDPVKTSSGSVESPHIANISVLGEGNLQELAKDSNGITYLESNKSSDCGITSSFDLQSSTNSPDVNTSCLMDRNVLEPSVLDSNPEQTEESLANDDLFTLMTPSANEDKQADTLQMETGDIDLLGVLDFSLVMEQEKQISDDNLTQTNSTSEGMTASVGSKGLAQAEILETGDWNVIQFEMASNSQKTEQAAISQTELTTNQSIQESEKVSEMFGRSTDENTSFHNAAATASHSQLETLETSGNELPTDAENVVEYQWNNTLDNPDAENSTAKEKTFPKSPSTVNYELAFEMLADFGDKETLTQTKETLANIQSKDEILTGSHAEQQTQVQFENEGMGSLLNMEQKLNDNSLTKSEDGVLANISDFTFDDLSDFQNNSPDSADLVETENTEKNMGRLVMSTDLNEFTFEDLTDNMSEENDFQEESIHRDSNEHLVDHQEDVIAPENHGNISLTETECDEKNMDVIKSNMPPVDLNDFTFTDLPGVMEANAGPENDSDPSLDVEVDPSSLQTPDERSNLEEKFDEDVESIVRCSLEIILEKVTGNTENVEDFEIITDFEINEAKSNVDSSVVQLPNNNKMYQHVEVTTVPIDHLFSQSSIDSEVGNVIADDHMPAIITDKPSEFPIQDQSIGKVQLETGVVSQASVLSGISLLSKIIATDNENVDWDKVSKLDSSTSQLDNDVNKRFIDRLIVCSEPASSSSGAQQGDDIITAQTNVFESKQQDNTAIDANSDPVQTEVSLKSEVLQANENNEQDALASGSLFPVNVNPSEGLQKNRDMDESSLLALDGNADINSDGNGLEKTEDSPVKNTENDTDDVVSSISVVPSICSIPVDDVKGNEEIGASAVAESETRSVEIGKNSTERTQPPLVTDDTAVAISEGGQSTEQLLGSEDMSTETTGQLTITGNFSQQSQCSSVPENTEEQLVSGLEGAQPFDTDSDKLIQEQDNQSMSSKSIELLETTQSLADLQTNETTAEMPDDGNVLNEIKLSEVPEGICNNSETQRPCDYDVIMGVNKPDVIENTLKHTEETVGCDKFTNDLRTEDPEKELDIAREIVNDFTTVDGVKGKDTDLLDHFQMQAEHVTTHSENTALIVGTACTYATSEESNGVAVDLEAIFENSGQGNVTAENDNVVSEHKDVEDLQTLLDDKEASIIHPDTEYSNNRRDNETKTGNEIVEVQMELFSENKISDLNMQQDDTITTVKHIDSIQATEGIQAADAHQAAHEFTATDASEVTSVDNDEAILAPDDAHNVPVAPKRKKKKPKARDDHLPELDGDQVLETSDVLETTIQHKAPSDAKELMDNNTNAAQDPPQEFHIKSPDEDSKSVEVSVFVHNSVILEKMEAKPTDNDNFEQDFTLEPSVHTAVKMSEIPVTSELEIESSVIQNTSKLTNDTFGDNGQAPTEASHAQSPAYSETLTLPVQMVATSQTCEVTNEQEADLNSGQVKEYKELYSNANLALEPPEQIGNVESTVPPEENNDIQEISDSSLQSSLSESNWQQVNERFETPMQSVIEPTPITSQPIKDKQTVELEKLIESEIFPVGISVTSENECSALLSSNPDVSIKNNEVQNQVINNSQDSSQLCKLEGEDVNGQGCTDVLNHSEEPCANETPKHLASTLFGERQSNVHLGDVNPEGALEYEKCEKNSLEARKTGIAEELNNFSHSEEVLLKDNSSLLDIDTKTKTSFPEGNFDTTAAVKLELLGPSKESTMRPPVVPEEVTEPARTNRVDPEVKLLLAGDNKLPEDNLDLIPGDLQHSELIRSEIQPSSTPENASEVTSSIQDPVKENLLASHNNDDDIIQKAETANEILESREIDDSHQGSKNTHQHNESSENILSGSDCTAIERQMNENYSVVSEENSDREEHSVTLLDNGGAVNDTVNDRAVPEELKMCSEAGALNVNGSGSSLPISPLSKVNLLTDQETTDQTEQFEFKQESDLTQYELCNKEKTPIVSDFNGNCVERIWLSDGNEELAGEVSIASDVLSSTNEDVSIIDTIMQENMQSITMNSFISNDDHFQLENTEKENYTAPRKVSDQSEDIISDVSTIVDSQMSTDNSETFFVRPVDLLDGVNNNEQPAFSNTEESVESSDSIVNNNIEVMENVSKNLIEVGDKDDTYGERQWIVDNGYQEFFGVGMLPEQSDNIIERLEEEDLNAREEHQTGSHSICEEKDNEWDSEEDRDSSSIGELVGGKTDIPSVREAEDLNAGDEHQDGSPLTCEENDNEWNSGDERDSSSVGELVGGNSNILGSLKAVDLNAGEEQQEDSHSICEEKENEWDSEYERDSSSVDEIPGGSSDIPGAPEAEEDAEKHRDNSENGNVLAFENDKDILSAGEMLKGADNILEAQEKEDVTSEPEELSAPDEEEDARAFEDGDFSDISLSPVKSIARRDDSEKQSDDEVGHPDENSVHPHPTSSSQNQEEYEKTPVDYDAQDEDGTQRILHLDPASNGQNQDESWNPPLVEYQSHSTNVIPDIEVTGPNSDEEEDDLDEEDSGSHDQQFRQSPAKDSEQQEYNMAISTVQAEVHAEMGNVDSSEPSHDDDVSVNARTLDSMSPVSLEFDDPFSDDVSFQKVIITSSNNSTHFTPVPLSTFVAGHSYSSSVPSSVFIDKDMLSEDSFEEDSLEGNCSHSSEEGGSDSGSDDNLYCDSRDSIRDFMRSAAELANTDFPVVSSPYVMESSSTSFTYQGFDPGWEDIEQERPIINALPSIPEESEPSDGEETVVTDVNVSVDQDKYAMDQREEDMNERDEEVMHNYEEEKDQEILEEKINAEPNVVAECGSNVRSTESYNGQENLGPLNGSDYREENLDYLEEDVSSPLQYLEENSQTTDFLQEKHTDIQVLIGPNENEVENITTSTRNTPQPTSAVDIKIQEQYQDTLIEGDVSVLNETQLSELDEELQNILAESEVNKFADVQVPIIRPVSPLPFVNVDDGNWKPDEDHNTHPDTIDVVNFEIPLRHAPPPPPRRVKETKNKEESEGESQTPALEDVLLKTIQPAPPPPPRRHKKAIDNSTEFVPIRDAPESNKRMAPQPPVMTHPGEGEILENLAQNSDDLPDECNIESTALREKKTSSPKKRMAPLPPNEHPDEKVNQVAALKDEEMLRNEAAQNTSITAGTVTGEILAANYDDRAEENQMNLEITPTDNVLMEFEQKNEYEGSLQEYTDMEIETYRQEFETLEEDEILHGHEDLDNSATQNPVIFAANVLTARAVSEGIQAAINNTETENMQNVDANGLEDLEIEQNIETIVPSVEISALSAESVSEEIPELKDDHPDLRSADVMNDGKPAGNVEVEEEQIVDFHPGVDSVESPSERVDAINLEFDTSQEKTDFLHKTEKFEPDTENVDMKEAYMELNFQIAAQYAPPQLEDSSSTQLLLETAVGLNANMEYLSLADKLRTENQTSSVDSAAEEESFAISENFATLTPIQFPGSRLDEGTVHPEENLIQTSTEGQEDQVDLDANEIQVTTLLQEYEFSKIDEISSIQGQNLVPEEALSPEIPAQKSNEEQTEVDVTNFLREDSVEKLDEKSSFPQEEDILLPSVDAEKNQEDSVEADAEEIQDLLDDVVTKVSLEEEKKFVSQFKEICLGLLDEMLNEVDNLEMTSELKNLSSIAEVKDEDEIGEIAGENVIQDVETCSLADVHSEPSGGNDEDSEEIFDEDEQPVAREDQEIDRVDGKEAAMYRIPLNSNEDGSSPRKPLSKRTRHDTTDSIGSLRYLTDSEEENETQQEQAPEQLISLDASEDEIVKTFTTDFTTLGEPMTIVGERRVKRKSLVPPSSLVLSVALDDIPITPVTPNQEPLPSLSETDLERSSDQITSQESALTERERSSSAQSNLSDSKTDDRIPRLPTLKSQHRAQPKPVLIETKHPQENMIQIATKPNLGYPVHWEKVTLKNIEYEIDGTSIQPYKRVIAHGGFYGDKSTIIEFFTSYLPDSNLPHYAWIMDNLFLYVIATMELLAQDKFSIVAFVGSTPKNQIPANSLLKRWHQHVDYRLKKNVEAFYIVQPTFYFRTMARLFISRKVLKKIKYIKNMNELRSHIPTDFLFVPAELSRRLDNDQRNTQIPQVTNRWTWLWMMIQSKPTGR